MSTATTTTNLAPRSMVGHCPLDPMNEICEKFLQIWSHKAANLSNELVEYTIRRMQRDRLRFLFQTRNELNQSEDIEPICTISMHTEDDLQRVKEHIRRFCLNTRNVYRHLRSDSRIHPTMCIDLDQGIMGKICRFIFKTKVLVKILDKAQHSSERQRAVADKVKLTSDIKLQEIHHPYRNVTKAFLVLQSNFELLFGDILDRDFFQNAKTAVQTLPIILDVSKTIRLIFCALYRLSEPERKAENEAIRQRRLAFCRHPCGSNKPAAIQQAQKQEISKIDSSSHQPTTTTLPSRTTKKDGIESNASKSKGQTSKISSKEKRTKTNSSKTNPSSSKSKSKKNEKNSTNKNTSANYHSSIDSLVTYSNRNKDNTKFERQKCQSTTSSSNDHQHLTTITEQILQTTIREEDNLEWTSWLRNATRSLAAMKPTDTSANVTSLLSSKPVRTTWASFDRSLKQNEFSVSKPT